MRTRITRARIAVLILVVLILLMFVGRFLPVMR